uniref:ORF16 n=1 Tax=Nitrosopumilaceae spindle-shaped virus TaxID=3065433 RepID=A0AAT9J989_9VIRU
MNWDGEKPKKSSYFNLNDNLLMSRKRFLLTNGVWFTIGFLCYYIFVA